MQPNSIAADSAADHAPLADASRWHPQHTVRTLGLFGTAIGAGVLFLPDHCRSADSGCRSELTRRHRKAAIERAIPE